MLSKSTKTITYKLNADQRFERKKIDLVTIKDRSLVVKSMGLEEKFGKIVFMKDNLKEVEIQAMED